MTNLINSDTTPDQLLENYKDYPDTQPRGFEPFHESRVLPIFYEIKDGAKVLDVGCNSGEFMKLLKEKKGCDVYGIDVAEGLVQKAKEKGLNAQKGDVHALPFADGTFDYVTLMEVLVHVFDPLKALLEIKRVLKRDGVLLGSAPHENLERHLWDDKRLHHHYYSETQLEAELAKVFGANYLRVMNGGQFALGFANSFLKDKPVEILFKSGGKKTKPWEEALLDKSVLRVWMGPTQSPGDVYYRMSGFADKMNELGCEIAYNPFEHNDAESPGAWQKAVLRNPMNPTKPSNGVVVDQLDAALKCADLSVWQLTAFKDVLAFFMAVKAVIKKPFVTELDDWMFDLPSYNIASNPYHPNSDAEWCAFQQLKMSDAIIVSTQFLKDKILEIFPSKPVHIVPNGLDFKIWDNLEAKKEFPFVRAPETVRIGYTGCGNHSGDLEIVKEPILALLEEFPHLEFVMPLPFESWNDIEHPRVWRVNKWVALPAYPAMVKGWELDIGIAPLRDNNMNRAKSNLRWLEYAALKLPTVASRVYPFVHSIQNGKDGFVCNTSEEWYEALKSLIVDKGMRADMGQTAYERVKRDFNMDQIAYRYIEVLKEIKNGPRSPSSRMRSPVRRSKSRSVVN